MSGVCPTVPSRTRNTYDDTPPLRDTFNIVIPDAVFNECGVGGENIDIVEPPRPDGETITIEVCCPSPGPAGPQGPTGATGEGVPVGGAADEVLTKIDGTDYNTEWRVTGIGTGNLVNQGVWANAIAYVENDFITLDNNCYVCTFDHTSDELTNKPDPELDGAPGGFFWLFMGGSLTSTESQGLLDDMLDGALDWMKDIENWGYEDYLLAAVAGAGLIWAGSELIDMFTDVPGDENSNYGGDAAYGGAYTQPLLPAVVSSLCDWAGITSYDVSALPSDNVSLKINALTSARSVLAILSQVYFFDMVDSEGTLKFIPRSSQTSVRSLTERDDLGWSTRGATAPVAIKRMQGIDLPNRVELEYVSEANAYNRFVQTATLETFTEGQTTKINLPVTLEDDKAFEIAERLIINSHIERTTYAFSTSYDHIDLEPADVITLENIGDVRILRVDEDKENGLLNFTAVDASFNAETYTPSGMANEAPTYTDVPVIIGKSAGLAIELPPLDATDIEQRLTLFPHGYGAAGWPGCAIYISIDGGVSYTEQEKAYVESTWGKATSIVPSISNWYVWDETTTITVELKTGTLSSVTDIEVQNGVNWCLIGEEVIGFKTATLIAANTYELTGLMRGRRGTEVFISTHVVDEGFILLDSAGVEFPYPADAKEKVFYFKYVTIGTELSAATAYVAQPSQKSRKPWRVANYVGTKVGNDFVVTWIGRNQFNGEMTDSGTVTQPNGFGGFVIQMLDAGNADAPVRTIYTQTPTVTYTEAQQVADFGSAQATVKVRVAQIDRIFGTGYEITEVF